jgi:hypothetical protein
VAEPNNRPYCDEIEETARRGPAQGHCNSGLSARAGGATFGDQIRAGKIHRIMIHLFVEHDVFPQEPASTSPDHALASRTFEF